MSKIELKHIDKFYGKNHILKDVNLTIEDGDFMTLLGPSGCGKTTTLRVVSGLEKPQNGTIHMDGKEIVNAAEAHFAPPSERDLNLVFQSYALWPHMTVRENIAFGLNIQKLPKDEVDRRIKDALGRMQIGQYVDRYPSELSGGQQQRVAIARAIASEPHLLLMDEPLSNLDAKLRVDMRSELKRLHTETGTTMIYVTHDQEEAMSISDMIIVMKEGVIQQIGKPQEVYDNPANLFVAKFLGTPPINVFRGQVKDHTLYIGKDAILKAGNVPDQEVWVGVRPEGFILNENGALHCNLSRIEVMGRDVSVVSTKEESENATIRSIISAENSVDTGSLVVSFDLKPNKVFLFHKDTQERIPYTGS